MGHFFNKKSIFAFVISCFLFSFNLLQAQTNVSGVISTNTNWTKAGSPYNVTGNLLVNSGVTLTVDPGVIVNFSSSKKLTIDGIVLAIGTITDSITFTGTSWNGITTNSGANGSKFKYSIIENTTGNTEEVRINLYGTTIIERCRVSNTNQGIMAYNSSQILYSKIYKSQCFGLYLESNSTAIGNDISYLNGCNNSINVNNGSTFSKNKVSNLSGEWGVRVYSGGIVEGNTFIAGTNGGNTSAIFCQGGMGGGGGGGVTYIRYNKFDGFKNNILIARDDVIVNGNSFIGGMDLSTQRNIRTQSGFSGTNIRVDATSNYWGNVTALNIPNSIEDYNDDYTLQGNVDYSTPLSYHHPLAPISSPNNILKKIVGTSVVLTWTANTESDIAGYKIYYGGYTGYSYTNSIDAGNVLTYTLPAGVSIDDDIAVTAYDASKTGTDDQSNGNESWYSPANKIPTTPTNLIAYASGHKVKLNWDVSTSTGVNNYNIYRSTDGTSFTKLISTTNNSYTNTGLTAYTKYYYKVAAFDSLDLSYDNYGIESDQTDAVNATSTNRFYVDSTIGSDVTGIGSNDSPYKKISTAVSAATTGDTILVGRGTYLDNIILTKVLTILAQNSQSNTIIKPLLPTSQIFNFTGGSDHSKLSGFTLTGGGNVRGSAIDCNFSSPTIENCIITNSGGEAPIHFYYTDAIINNCIIYKNTAGNVIFYDPNDKIPTINHSTIVYNSGIGTGSSNTSFIPIFTNCIIYGNTGGSTGGNISIINSIVQGGYLGNETNINANPSFIDTANDNYHLQNYSPAIGLGSTTLSINKDFEGNNRVIPNSTNPDAGAYEKIYDHPSPLIYSDSSIESFVLLKLNQNPIGSVNKFSIYKGLTSSPTTKYLDTTLISKFTDSANSIFNDVIYYRLTSTGSSNIESGYSNTIRTIVFTAPTLGSPSNSISKVDTNSIFNWSKINNATHYNLQYSTDSTFLSNVIEINKTDTFYNKISLVDNTTYYWRVRTLDSVHYSKWSNFNRFQTFVRKPLLNSISSVNRIITLNWAVNSIRNIKSFKIYKGTTTNPTTKIDSISSANLTYNDSVANGVKFYYRITAINTDNVESDFSNELFANSFNSTSLDSPSNYKIKVTLNPTFKWQEVEYVSRNNIQISKDSLFLTTPLLDTITNLNFFNYKKNLEDNTTYYWRVRVGDEKGYGNWTTKNTFQTYILPPNFATISPSNKIDTLKWTVLTNNNIKYFKIYRDSINNPAKLIDSISGIQRVYIDTINLQLNKKYYYRIVTGNIQNIESDYSNIINATPFNTKPKAASFENKTFDNIGEYNFIRTTYSAASSKDIDGKIVNYKWYINDSLVNSTDSILIYYYKQGTNDLKLVITDNDGDKDSSSAKVILNTFTKTFKGGFLGGVTALSPDRILTADSTFDPINGASVYMLDRSGNTIFPLIVSSKIFTTPSVSTDSSVFITSGSSLNGFSKSGSPLWSTIPLGGNSFVTPTIDSLLSRIYLGVSNKNFFAIDYKSGKVVWNIIGDAAINSSAVITGDRKLVFTSQSGTLYGYDIRSSAIQTAAKWKYSIGEIVSKSPAVDASNNLYIGTDAGNLVKLSLKEDSTVTKVWSIKLSGAIQSSAVIDGDGFIYIGNEKGDFYKINPIDGTIIWTYSTAAAIRSTPAMSDFGSIYFANMNGLITSIASDKSIKWKYQESSPISANLLYINNMIYAGTEAGKLFAVFDNPNSNSVNTALSIVGTPANLESSKIKSMAIVDSVVTKKPIWGTFQGNYRRTGSRDFDCPETPIVRIPSCAITGDSIRISTNDLVNKYWIINDKSSDIKDTVIYAKPTDKIRIVAFNTNGCNVSSATSIIIPNSDVTKPTIVTNTGYDKFCQNDSITLSTPIGVASYQWNFAGYPISNAKNKTLTTNLSGAYSLSVVNNYGCKSVSDISLVMAIAKPDAPSLSRDTAGNLVSSAASGNQWYKAGAIIPGATSKSYKPSTPSTYSVSTNSYGCISSLSTSYYFLITDVINLSAYEFIKLVPNPFVNQLNFDFSIKGYQKLNLDIFEISTGNLMASKQGVYAGTPIVLGQLSSGTYIVRVSSTDGKIMYQFKMIKL